MKHLNLHPLFKPYRKEIEATLKPVVRIKATPGKALLWQSKFGGNAYIPKDMPIENFDYAKRYKETAFPYPRNIETGGELYLLAQINFEEMPHIEPFPTKGLLQIFIDVNVSAYGRKDDFTNQTAFRTIYYPSIIKDESLLWTDFNRLPTFNQEVDEEEYTLQFDLDEEPISRDDFRFEKIYKKDLSDKINYPSKTYKNEGMQSYFQLTRDKDGEKNKIGGYHYSLQGWDPRPVYFGEDEPSVLLIQFDGCDVFSWGDGGTACFFITEKDLRNLNFSNVIYHWDCT